MKLSGKIQFIQHNTNRNPHVMHTCLDYAIKLKIDFVAFQEPYIAKDNITTISHSAFYCILPPTQNIRPRVMIFARKQSRFDFCLRSDICTDNDILIIDIIDKTSSYSEVIQLINIYNEKSLKEDCTEYTVKRKLHEIVPSKNTILCGDLNAHHSWWNSTITNSKNANDLIDWLEKYEFDLLNKPDQQTCTRSNTSIIDLTFISKSLNKLHAFWEISEQDSGSNHMIIQFAIYIDNKNLVENLLYNNQYNFDKANWKQFKIDLVNAANTDEFQTHLDNSIISPDILEKEAVKLRDIILKAAENIPKKRVTEYSKCWWNDELKVLRKELSMTRRNWKERLVSQQEYQQARTKYFQQIKLEKAKCWNSFLENAVGKEIFKAFNYTKSNRVEKLPIIKYSYQNQENIAITFKQKCEAFMKVLFINLSQTEEIK